MPEPDRTANVPPPARAARDGRADLLAVGLPLAILYLVTLATDLGTVDSGELAAVGAGLGIAHPPGYPLYTLLGRLAVLVFPFRPIVDASLLSAASGVVAALLVARTARLIAAPGRGRSDGDGIGAGWAGRRLFPWTAALLFGTSGVFWAQSVGNEVYALHLVFVAALLHRSIVLLRAESGPRDLLLLGWIGGLALAHHLSIAFLAPAVLAALVVHLARRGDGGRPALRAAAPGGPPRVAPTSSAPPVGGPPSRGGVARGPFPGRLAPLALAVLAALLAWSVVLYLPIRGAQDPRLEWGDPTAWGRFWNHVGGAQYRVWMFESAADWTANLRGYFAGLPGRLIWPVLILAVPGLLFLWRDRPRAALLLTLVAVVTVLWASSYVINDLEPYYLPSDLVLSLAAAYGAGRLVPPLLRARRLARSRVAALAAVAGALVLLQTALHFRGADRRGETFIRFHAETVLRGLPERAVLLSRFWDALVSPALYLQEVEGMRRDVAVVDVELLRRSWYFAQLRRWDASLLAPLETEVAAFVRRVEDFEAGRPHDPNRLEEGYRSLMVGIPLAQRPQRPTAVTSDAEADLRMAGVIVPEGLAGVLRDGPQDARPVEPPDVAGLLRSGYRPEDRIHRLVVLTWEHDLEARIRFLEVMGRAEELAAWRAALERIRPVAAEARRRGV